MNPRRELLRAASKISFFTLFLLAMVVYLLQVNFEAQEIIFHSKWHDLKTQARTRNATEIRTTLSDDCECKTDNSDQLREKIEALEQDLKQQEGYKMTYFFFFYISKNILFSPSLQSQIRAGISVEWGEFRGSPRGQWKSHRIPNGKLCKIVLGWKSERVSQGEDLVQG